ncbi:MAG: T9SS type A sorting domain-containing protein, partial [Bacteroidetes bacterium]|nr:T9SS type A sorting domain-containing protein [Bacteroidota bacterium]
WDTISETIDPITIFTNNDLVLTGFWGGIYKSNDHGNNWNLVLELQNTELVSAIIQNETTGELFAGAKNFIGGGGVYRSIDGGDTWEHFGLYDHYVSSLAFNSSGDLFAGTRGHTYLYSGGVFMLPNGQMDWITLNDEELVTSIVINSADEIYIGCSNLDWYIGGVRRSEDNGQTWEDISTGIGDRNIEDLEIGPDGHLYVSGYFTPLFRSVNSTITGIEEQSNQVNIITYNYPNPFADETTIYFSFASDDLVDVQVTIYDSQGKKMKDIFPLKYSGNEQSIKFHSQDLPAGIYYYNLSVGSHQISNKMVLQKFYNSRRSL